MFFRESNCATLLNYTQGVLGCAELISTKDEQSLPSRAANTMEVGLCHSGEIKVDDNIHGLDVDTCN